MNASNIGAVADEQSRLTTRRHILTPEGVPIPVDLADRGNRLGALLIDLLLLYVVIAVLGLLLTFAAFGGFPTQWAITMILLLSFLLRSFYFIYFELRWQGRTPGKRALGIRVIDRHGQPLSAEAVFARNLMREVEVFVPASVLFALPFAGKDLSFYFLLLWVGALVALPFINRDRMRAGDILAGTWVVRAPKQSLLPEIAEAADTTRLTGDGDIRFSRAQLEIYGIFELQTLEDILRQDGPKADQARAEVASRIKKKIAWQDPPGRTPNDRTFLEAFYIALRGHLETRLLFGERRQDKFHRNDKPQP